MEENPLFAQISPGRDWQYRGDGRWERYGGEEYLTVHAVGMQDGTWTGVVVYEVVDSRVQHEDFESRGGVIASIHDCINKLVRQ